MKLKITKSASKRKIRGGYLQAVNTTSEGHAATLTTRYEAICHSNILTLAHYPMTVVLYKYEPTKEEAFVKHGKICDAETCED